VTIGVGSEIGGNVWITHDISAQSDDADAETESSDPTSPGRQVDQDQVQLTLAEARGKPA
jgi:hypothetical protein